MKKVLTPLILISILLAGCETLRFAPNQAQKQNTWLHNRTAIITAQTACAENTSQKLQALTNLSELQSRAFVSYYGLPEELPAAETDEDILNQSSFNLARTVLADSADRPDTWQIADSALELGIGLCALFGGVYGTATVRFLKQARAKSKALREIIMGNELFKKQYTEFADKFKEAQKNQSLQTRQIVAEMKS